MTEESTRPLKVFLCHASGDKPAVRALYQRLLRDGVDAWLDKEKLLPGQDWQLEIPKAVRESDVVVICLSNKSITKEGYVQKEIKFALDFATEKPEGTIFLIPARLEECSVPVQLGLWQWVDLFETDGYERLMRSLRLRADKLGLRVGDTIYTDQEVEQRLDQLYTEGLAALWVEDWDKAYHRFQAILRERPDHIQAIAKLDEAKRQKYLNTLYAQALEAQEGENWQMMVQILEKLTQEVSDYKDASLLLKDARKKNHLAHLYNEAHRLYKAQQWQAVIKVFDQITALEPNYHDPDGLLPSAEKELIELKRLNQLKEFYSRGVREMDAGNWYEARRVLEQVHKSQIGFLETERLLKKVENEINKIEELNRRNIYVNTLYEQAHELIRSKNWRKALDKIEEIQKLDSQFVDKDSIFEKARAQLDREEEVVQRQNELAAMYTEAVRLLKEGKYQEALDKWQEVKALDPKYPDRQSVQRIARKKLLEISDIRPAHLKNIKPAMFRSSWAWMLGAMTLVVVIGAIIWSASRNLNVEQNPTQLPLPLTETSTTPMIVTTEVSPLASTPIGADILPIQRVVRSNKFEALPLSDFELNGNYNLSNGILRLEEPLVSGDPWVDGAVSLDSEFSVKQGNGYLLLFRALEPGTQFLINFEVGPFDDPSYRAFWFESGQSISVWKGQQTIFSSALNFQFQQDTWYYLFMRPYSNDVEIRLWEKDHPENVFDFRTDTETEWTSDSLRFHVGLPEGVMEIDEFQEVEFSVSELLSIAESPTPVPMAYDNFDDPVWDGKINPSFWIKRNNCGSVSQQSGNLVFKNSNEGCDLVIKQPGEVRGEELGVLEAKLMVGDDHKGGIVTQEIDFFTYDLQGGLWWSICGIHADNGKINIFFNVENLGAKKPADLNKTIPAQYNQWYVFRMGVDRETMRFSCQVNDVTIGSVIPKDAEMLRNAHFERVTEGARDSGASVTSYVDYIQIFP